MKTFLPGKTFLHIQSSRNEELLCEFTFSNWKKKNGSQLSEPSAGDQMCYITRRIAMKWEIWSKKTPARTKTHADELLIKHSWWFETQSWFIFMHQRSKLNQKSRYINRENQLKVCVFRWLQVVTEHRPAWRQISPLCGLTEPDAAMHE